MIERFIYLCVFTMFGGICMEQERIIYVHAVKSKNNLQIMLRKSDVEALGIEDRDELRMIVSKTGRKVDKKVKNYTEAQKRYFQRTSVVNPIDEDPIDEDDEEKTEFERNQEEKFREFGGDDGTETSN